MKRGRIFLSTALRNIQYSSHSLKNFSVQIAKDINLSESENSDSFYYQVDMMPVKSHVLHPYPLKVYLTCFYLLIEISLNLLSVKFEY